MEGVRPGLAAGLTAAGCTVIPGQANYLLFRMPGVADLKERLLTRGVLIRSCANYHGLGPDWYRVCVKGAPDVLSRRCRLDGAAERRLEARNEAMASRALRVLGVFVLTGFVIGAGGSVLAIRKFLQV